MRLFNHWLNKKTLLLSLSLVQCHLVVVLCRIMWGCIFIAQIKFSFILFQTYPSPFDFHSTQKMKGCFLSPYSLVLKKLNCFRKNYVCQNICFGNLKSVVYWTESILFIECLKFTNSFHTPLFISFELNSTQ